MRENKKAAMDRPAAYGINENHRRFLTVNLGMLEKELHYIEYLIQAAPRGRMYSVTNGLSGEQAGRTLAAIQKLRECIGDFADSFGLQPIQEDIKNKIDGDFTISWADICGIEPKNLKGYGRVGTDAEDELNRHIGRLKKLLEFRV
jgi:hypothetical protein